ncbi:MAG: PA0069 family radical SAM protein [Verrucomicrobia bacterium]|nr:PA0069 family radical SAM protein [Verrucomicrobiota bacterium]
MEPPSAPIQTRGASGNPPNRFERLSLEPEPDWYDPDEPVPPTHFYRDTTSTIITYNDSPDVGFSASVNPYRGCEHGCIYCYARPYHEFLGFSAGLDFETKIMVKEAAPELLRRELASPRWQPQVIAMSGVTDCYQPVERRLQLTRRCLEVLAEFRNPVGIVTKNLLVTRDVDVLQELARHHAAAIFISVTTLDPELRKIMEPRTSPPSARLTAIRTLAQAGIAVGVMVAPVIPGLTDHELPKILAAAADAGATFAVCVPVRLPLTVAPLFEGWLEQHLPAKKEKVLNRIRAIRGGQLNDPNFGTRMRGEGIFAEQIERMFTVACRKAGLTADGPELSTAAFRRPEGAQLSLFS